MLFKGRVLCPYIDYERKFKENYCNNIYLITERYSLRYETSEAIREIIVICIFRNIILSISSYLSSNLSTNLNLSEYHLQNYKNFKDILPNMHVISYILYEYSKYNEYMSHKEVEWAMYR